MSSQVLLGKADTNKYNFSIEPSDMSIGDIFGAATNVTYLSSNQLGEFIGLILIHGRVTPELELVNPLPLYIELEEGYFIVSDEVFSAYGVGDTVREALRDYYDALMSFVEIISGDRERNHLLLDEIERYLIIH